MPKGFSTPLNAFARRYEAGLLGETLPGYPFDANGRARVAKLAAKAPKAKRAPVAKAAPSCPHCGERLAA